LKSRSFDPIKRVGKQDTPAGATFNICRRSAPERAGKRSLEGWGPVEARQCDSPKDERDARDVRLSEGQDENHRILLSQIAEN
jgi:hypothetical protein